MHAAALTSDETSLDSLELHSAGIDQFSMRPGDKLGRYVLTRQLGAGGMGVVFEAYDPQLERLAALKLSRPLSATDVSARRKLGERLRREGQALARLSSPHIPAVYDVGLVENMPFIATELIVGPTLRDWWRSNKPSWRELTSVMLQVARGLAVAHEAGLVHRDVKPENVIVGNDGIVRVLDFGLVASLSTPEPSTPVLDASPPEPPRAFAHHLTQHGATLGTPAYMAPEQLHGESTDAHCDQFGFCVMYYEALVGERPFDDADGRTDFDAVCRGRLRPHPREGRGPEWLLKLIECGLSVDPKGRFHSISALSSAIEIELARRRRWRRSLLVGFACASLAMTAAIPRVEVRDCSFGKTRIASVFGPKQQLKAEAVFVQLGPVAGETWQLIEPRLEDYRRTWADRHAENCRATHIDRTQSDEAMDRVTACLDRGLSALSTLAQFLTRPDPRLVRSVAEAVEALPDVGECNGRNGPRLPASIRNDPARLAQLRQAENQLERLRTMRLAGQHDQLDDLELRLRQSAESLDYRPLLAAMFHEFGLRRGYYFSQPKQAVEDHTRALHHAMAAKLSQKAAQAASQRLLRAAIDGGPPASIMELAAHAEAMLIAAGRTPELNHDFALSYGVALFMAGNPLESLASFRAHLRTTLADFGANSLPVARTRLNIGLTLGITGDSAGAVEELRSAVEIFRARLGPSHELVQRGLDMIAEAQRGLGDYLGVLETTETIARLCDREFGPNSKQCIPRHEALAWRLAHLGRYRAADSLLTSLEHRFSGPDSVAISLPHEGIAASDRLRWRGEVEASLVTEREFLERLRADEQLPWQHRGESMVRLAHASIAAERFEEARAWIARAQKLHDETYRPREDFLRKLGGARAELFASLGQHRRAAAEYERTLAEHVALHIWPRSHPHFAVENLGLVRSLRELGALDEADRLLEPVLEGLERAFGSDNHRLVPYLLELGHLHFAHGKLSRAEATFQRALATFDPHELHPNRSAEIYVALARVYRSMGERRLARSLDLTALELYQQWDAGARARIRALQRRGTARG